MKKRQKAALALTLATVMACGTLAGCDLVTQDGEKDLQQVVAEINITKSEDFAEGGIYGDKHYENVLQTASILKRDLVLGYISQGATLQQYYGYSYADVFDMISESLVQNQVFLQYAMVYFFEHGSTDEKGVTTSYTVEAYKQAISGDFADETDRSIAGLAYFLTDEEEQKVDYDLRVSINNSLDQIEPNYIKSEEDEHDHDTDVRTTPTGVETTDEDYSLPASAEEGEKSYAIYTGNNHVSECGTYEEVEGSTATSRKRAYSQYLSNLLSSSLLQKGEDITKVEELSYYRIQRKSAYENALVQKLTDSFTYEKEQELKADDYAAVQNKIEETYKAQKAAYENDADSFESQLDSVSDTNFLFYSPASYGFVINILLPFSETQKNALTNAENDEGKSTKYIARAKLLQNVKATDQRRTWFTGHDDYSYDGSAEEGVYTGKLENASERKYLFFEDSLARTADGKTGTEYEPIKNYYGKYTYNGTVEIKEEDEEGHKTYKVTPKPITVDEFIAEMEGYLNAVLGADKASGAKLNDDYFTQDDFSKEGGKKGEVDYEKFLYYQGKVNFDSFDPNQIFAYGTQENKAFSVINELSFAYNTDTAGLNSYLGYAVSPYTTDFVKEFEAAAQIAVEGGAGTYTVAPSDYGWHIMYCTFSYKDAPDAPFYTFDKDDVETEGTFSNLYFEALKSNAVSTKTTNMRTQAIGKYAIYEEDGKSGCVKLYQDRYEDLRSMT